MRWLIGLMMVVAVCCIAPFADARERSFAKTTQYTITHGAVQVAPMASAVQVAASNQTCNCGPNCPCNQTNLNAQTSLTPLPEGATYTTGTPTQQVNKLVTRSRSTSVAASSNPFVSVANAYSGPRAEAIGMSTRYHLLQHHGYTDAALNGLNESQLRNLHSLEHKRN